MTITTPVVLLAPAPGMVFAAAPSGWNYTADNYGLIAVTNGSVADIQALIGEGCTLLSPSVQYTDLNYTSAVAAATTAALPANTYANGAAGVGATLTGSANGALSAIDGVTPTSGMRLWVKNEASAANNGLYVVTQVGGASTPYILTRSSDANTPALLGNLAAFVNGGSANIGNTCAVPLAFGSITIGTTAINPVQVNGPNGVAAETARAEASEAALGANAAPAANGLANDVIFPDDPYYAGGIFDGSGKPLLGLLPNGASNGLVVVPPLAVGDDPVWPDDVSTIAGDIGLADMNGNLLFPLPTSLISSTASSVAASTVATAFTVNLPSEDQVWPDDVSTIAGDIGLADMNANLLDYRWASSPNNSYVSYTDGTSYVCAVSPSGPSSTLDTPIASARGANASAPSPAIRGLGQPDSNGLLKWMDDGTADGMAGGPYYTPAHEARLFNFAGAAAVTALSGVNKIVFVPMIGQSLSNGTTASPLTTANVFNRAFMFNGGPMPYQEFNSSYPAPGALCQDSQLQNLVPLVEIEKPGGSCGETYGGGISYWLGQGTNLESTSALVYATLGQGGACFSASQMQQYNGSASNTMFASVIRCVERIAAWCKLNGLTLEVPCIVFDQGENDYTFSGSTYYTDLLALQTAYNTAIGSILTKIGQTPPSEIPFLMVQPSSWAFYSDTTAPNVYEQLQAVINNPTKFVMCCPQYWNLNYNTGSGQHMTGLGYRQCAEYAGRAIQRLRASAASEAVYATAVSNSGTTITITFSNVTQLVHDTSQVSDPNSQWGIRLLANGSNVALLGFSIVGTSQIQCTAASSISGQSCMLGIADYAYGTLGLVSGPTTSARAPIRDSATDVSSAVAGSIAMYNFACHQQISFTGA